MSTRKLLAVLAALIIGVLPVPGAVARGLAADAGGEPAEEAVEVEAAPSTQFCMFDNFNRIFKLNQVVVVLVIGQLWARPFNGFVFGTLLPQQTGGYKVQMSFFDPSVLTFWNCQGTGQNIGYFNGTCKAGQQTLPWSTLKQSTCPF